MLASTCNIPDSAQGLLAELHRHAQNHAQLSHRLAHRRIAEPLVSTLNAPTGTVVANAAIVPAGTSGAISVYASDATDLVIDINGYFAPPSNFAGHARLPRRSIP